MIKKCQINDYEKIIEYIDDSFYKCLYLYLDIKKYGFDNSNIKTYFQMKDEKIKALILTYYKSMHVFSKDNSIEYNELLDFINEVKPTMICGEKSIIEKIKKFEIGKKYSEEYGFVRSIKDIIYNKKMTIELAKKDDFQYITQLLMSDRGLSGSFGYDELHNQLIERFEQGFCRNYIYKSDGKIVGHVCSGAEDDKCVVLTDLIVDKDYRGRGIGEKICLDFCKLMIDEGKEVFLINYTDQSGNLYEKVGIKKRCEWGKLYIEKK